MPKAPNSFNWMVLPFKQVHAVRSFLEHRDDGKVQQVVPDAPLYTCLRRKDAGLVDKFEAELLGDWPAPGQRSQLETASKLVRACACASACVRICVHLQLQLHLHLHACAYACTCRCMRA